MPRSFASLILLDLYGLLALLWAGLLDELTHTAKPVSKFSQEFLLGLILEAEVDKFGKRKLQCQASSSGQVRICWCCVELAVQSLLNSVEPIFPAKERWPGPL